MLIKDFPPISAMIDSPILAIMLTASVPYWLFSNKLLESSANEDIVVKEPQNPTAANREYLPSRLHCCETTTNMPRINAPITFTVKTFSGNVLKSNGDSVILYLRNAPKTEPAARKTNSSPFIFCS